MLMDLDDLNILFLSINIPTSRAGPWGVQTAQWK